MTMRRYFFILICLLFFTSSICFAQTSAQEARYVKRGVSRFVKGDFDGAINYFNKAIANNPRLGAAYFNRGKARRAKGDLDGAINDYEKAIEIDPTVAYNNRDIAEAYSNRGYIKSGRLDLDGAITDFNKAIKSDPGNADTYLKRGRALLIDGNLKESI